MLNSKSNALEKMKSHPMLKNLFKKLTQDELKQVEDFIKENEQLSKNDYAHKANRWFLDQPKPKHYSDMWAIVMQVNQ